MWTHLFGGPDWMPITPKRGSFLHADSHLRFQLRSLMHDTYETHGFAR